MSNSVYNSGRVILSNTTTIDSLCKQAAKLMGVNAYPAPLIVVDNDALRVAGYIAGYHPEQKKITVPQRVAEGEAFHECVHHIANCNGMYVIKNMSAITFYSYLCDETLAEFATARKFGYAADVNGLNIEEAYAGVLRYQRAPENGPRISTQFLNGVVIAKRHLLLHEQYLQALQAESKAYPAVLASIPEENPGEWYNGFSLGMRFVAYTCAKQLVKRNITPAELGVRLKEDIAQGKDPKEIYLGTILRAAAGV